MIMQHILHGAALLALFGPYASGTADVPVDRGTVGIVAFFALLAYAHALKRNEDRRIERLEAFCRQLNVRGKNLRQGARIEDFRDVFR